LTFSSILSLTSFSSLATALTLDVAVHPDPLSGERHPDLVSTLRLCHGSGQLAAAWEDMETVAWPRWLAGGHRIIALDAMTEDFHGSYDLHLVHISQRSRRNRRGTATIDVPDTGIDSPALLESTSSPGSTTGSSWVAARLTLARRLEV
jgi:hypothetical protein